VALTLIAPAAPPPLPGLRRLLGRPDLHLRLLTPEAGLPPHALDQPVEWVHSSDLADPTPFLSAHQVLLTTGRQFAEVVTDAFYIDYVTRLRDRGIVCLGFGTEVLRSGTPDALVAACQSRGLPLVEVPYETPFIAVARAAGDLVAELRYARNTWALGAQRAIALAALRPDGLSATLSELSNQLGHWVALFDMSGALDRWNGQPSWSRAVGSCSTLPRAPMTGDEAGRLVVDGRPLPFEPVRVAVTDPSPARQGALTEFLELRVEESPGHLFFARLRGLVVLCLDAGAEPLLDELVGFGLHLGLSDRTRYSELPHALAQARQALERSHEGAPGIVEFDVISRQGVLAFLAGTDASEVGRATLQPLAAYDGAHGTDLVRTLRIWLEQNGQFGPAAEILGVHRHTVRARVSQAETLLGRDFGTFHARADIWAALLAAGDAAPA